MPAAPLAAGDERERCENLSTWITQSTEAAVLTNKVSLTHGCSSISARPLIDAATTRAEKQCCSTLRNANSGVKSGLA